MAKKNNSSALKVNEALIRQSAETYKYSGGAGSTMVDPIDWGGAVEDVAKGIMGERMKQEEEEKPSDNNTTKKPEKKENKVPRKEPRRVIIDSESSEFIINPDWILWNEIYGDGKKKSDGSALPQREKGKKITSQEPLEIGPPYSDSYLRSRGMDPKMYRRLVAEQKKEKPVSPRKKKGTAFKKYSALKSRTRESYIPTSSPMQQRFKSKDMVYGGRVGAPATIYDTWGSLPEEKLNDMKKNHVANTTFGSASTNQIDVLKNPKHKATVRNYLKKAKENMINALNDGQIEFKDQWMDNVKNLVGNLGSMNTKYGGWVDMNKSSQFEKSSFNNLISKGSHKGDQRKYDLTYMGSDKINMSISEEGDMYFKADGIEDVWTVKDLDRNVFAKNFQGYKVWDSFIEDMKKTNKEGGKISEGALEAVIEGVTQGKESLLSWFYDFGLFDKLEKQAEENGVMMDLDQIMPESERFNIDLIEDLVKNGLVSMAKERIGMETSKLTGQSASDLINKYRK
ncbi:MAG: hypothetical protein CMI60_09840 [Parvibaculum sp.]|nr:hypothetical protein [Parvibaculum sp.]